MCRHGKKIIGQTSNVPSSNQWGDSRRSWRASADPKINVLFLSPIPLVWIRNRCPTEVTWYSGGNSGRTSLTTGLGWRCLSCRCDLVFLPKWSNDARLSAKASETFRTSALTIPLGLSKLSHALLLILSFILVVSRFVAEWGCVCSLTCSTKLSNSSNLIEARHSPFLLSSHSHEVISFARFFWINIYTHLLITF